MIKSQYSGQNTHGMSLIETMIAMVIFMMLALGITSSVLQSQQTAQNNIIRNTAFTVGQGYLEQIKSISLANIREAIDDPSDTPLPTKSISILNIDNIEIEDPIFLDGPDPALPGQSDGSNFREILIDIQENPETGATREITMDAWFDIDVVEVENRSHAFAITVRFEASLRGRGQNRVRGELRGIRSDVNQSKIAQ